jgi:hypothetical protein
VIPAGFLLAVSVCEDSWLASGLSKRLAWPDAKLKKLSAVGVASASVDSTLRMSKIID